MALVIAPSIGYSSAVADQMHYERLVEEALRGVLRTVLLRAAEGLPPPHHLYVAFRTSYPGVALPPRLVEEYPNEMTIVLKSHYWDMVVLDDRFEVTLSFHGQRERVAVPLLAVSQISDPSVEFGLRFVVPEPPAPKLAFAPSADEDAPDAAPEGESNVVSLFGRRGPS